MIRRPLEVVVTWDDATSEPSDHATWDWKPEALEKLGKFDLERGRNTIGYLCYIDADKVTLFHDADDDNWLGNRSTIPTGWVTKIRLSGRKTILYRR